MSNPAQTDYQKIVSANDLKDNGGTILHGGNIDNKNITNADFVDIVGTSTPNSTLPVVGMPHVTSGIHSEAGNFAKMVAGTYLNIGNITELAGVSNTALQTTGGDFGRQSIHKNEQTWTLLVSASGWDYTTGALVGAYTSNDSFGNDEAARPTRALPGELVIHEGYTGNPTQKDYEARQDG